MAQPEEFIDRPGKSRVCGPVAPLRGPVRPSFEPRDSSAGHPGDTDEPKVYFDQASDMVMSFGTHHKEKEFWQRALVLISRTHSLTQTHALYLEWLSIQEAKKVGRYIVMNGNGGSR